MFWFTVLFVLLIALAVGYYALAGLLLAVWGVSYALCRAVWSQRVAVVGSVLTLWAFVGWLVWFLTHDGQAVVLGMGISGIAILWNAPWAFASD